MFGLPTKDPIDGQKVRKSQIAVTIKGVARNMCTPARLMDHSPKAWVAKKPVLSAVFATHGSVLHRILATAGIG